MTKAERLQNIQAIMGEPAIFHEPFRVKSERFGEVLAAMICSPLGNRDNCLSLLVLNIKITHYSFTTFFGTLCPQIVAPPGGVTLGNPVGVGGKRRRDSCMHARR